MSDERTTPTVYDARAQEIYKLRAEAERQTHPAWMAYTIAEIGERLADLEAESERQRRKNDALRWLYEEATGRKVSVADYRRAIEALDLTEPG